MARNLADYCDIAEHAIGGDVDSRPPVKDIVNEAGRYLVDSHEWSWLLRPPYDLNFVSGQNHVDLPADFRSVVSVEVSNSLETTINLTTLDEVVDLRGSSLNDPFRYHIAIAWPTQQDKQSNAAVPRLEIWPNISSNSTAALRLIYKAGWVELYGMQDVPNIPADMETLLSQYVTAFARGYNIPGQTVAQQVQIVDTSMFMKRLKVKYGMTQGNLGKHTGGIIPTEDKYTYRPHSSITRG